MPSGHLSSLGLWRILALLAFCLTCGSAVSQESARFVRGDVDVNRAHDVTDVLTVLQHLFLQQPERLECEDAADANDDGAVNLTDALTILFFLFEAGPLIPDPVIACGEDPTPDDFGCESFWACGTGSYENVIGMRLVPIPAGEFQMGSPVNERGRYPDETLHTVVITCPFYMGATEVTQRQYLEIMGVNPSFFNGSKNGFNFGTNLNRPVDSVSWHDGMAFCRRLSERDGRRYRLPYEAEWEYACRAGTTTRFWFGDALECDEIGRPAGPCTQADPFMVMNDYIELREPVAQKLPNPFGLFDMHGSGDEWCMDWYGAYPEVPVVNPKGPATGSFKILRSLSDVGMPLIYRRSAHRKAIDPHTNNFLYLGFRVAAELPDCRYGYQ